VDYGKHIFEDPVTHQVFGVTPAGRYHVRHCDLNDDLYVAERRDRAEIGKARLGNKRHRIPFIFPLCTAEFGLVAITRQRAGSGTG